jgi:4-azaleucine resistance transporter AzlC
MHPDLDESLHVPGSATRLNGQPNWLRGVKAGMPIAIGYIPIAMAFGLLAKSAGIQNYVAILMSLLVFAGASQFVGINLLTLSTPYWLIALTTFVLNSRHFLMSASLSRRVENGAKKRSLMLLAFGITDETFSVASLQQEAKFPISYLLSLNFTAYGAWNIGTWIGLFLAQALPKSIQSSMGIALYAMFIGLLVPSLRTSHKLLILALSSALLNTIFHKLNLFGGLSIGLNIVLTTFIIAALGAIFFKGEND